MRFRRGVALGVAGLLLLGGCADGTAGPPGQAVGAEPAPTQGAAPPAQRVEPGTLLRGSPSQQLALSTGWGPTRAQLDAAALAVRRLPLADLAGQVIVARYAGTRAPVELVRDLHLGGVISFTDNVVAPDQLRRLHARLRSAADRDWPLFLAVDQEGGVVQRVRSGATTFPAFMTAGAADRPGITRAAARAMGAELRWMGFTVDLAPVADVTSGPDDPTIGSRSPGSRPGLVARHAAAAAAGLDAAGLLPVVKHFPGHGSVPADSHLTLPVQTRTRRQLAAIDLVPFRRHVAGGGGAVMVAHLDVRAVDPGRPSSLSRPVVDGLLRDQLGFAGLVVTDALEMAAVTAGRSPGQASVAALRAGADVLLMPVDPRAARAAIVAAVRAGRLSRGRLQQAAARQVAALRHHQRRWRADPGTRPGSGAGAATALSRAAVTVVAGPCRGRLVGSAVRPVGSPAAVAAFTSAARAAGLATGSGDVVRLLGRSSAAGDADVAVATDAPYPLGGSSAPVRIAAYSETPAAMRAVVDVLLGELRAPGRLPVPVPGVERAGC